MDRFIGLDAHSQTCTLAVMGTTGKRLQERVIETNAKVLIDAVRGVAGRRVLCTEEGTHSEWLYEILSPHVDRMIVVQPSRSAGRKSDSIDAWALADLVRKDDVRGQVFKSPGAFTALREAMRGHQAVLRDLVRAKSRLKAIYRSRGLQGMGNDIYDPEKRKPWLVKLPPNHEQLAKLLSVELDGLISVHAQAEEWLLEQASLCPEVRRLATAPGIGRIRAAQIVAIVVTPDRFRTKQQFWSYCGLGIITRSSSDWVRESKGGAWTRKEVAQTRGLNRNRQPLLKAIFKGAATTVVMMMSKHPLHADYQRALQAGTKPNLARVTLARRIASAVLAIWKKKEDYDSAKHRQLGAA
jgi:transposase